MFLPIGFDEETVIQVIGELIDPIHIPVTPQQLTAYLDHNNFWSDTNDITEVTYAVMESNDILATRKMAAMFENGHHRRIVWNQWAPTVNSSNYKPYNANNVSATVEDGVITQTWLTQTKDYQSSINTTALKTHAAHRYYYMSYEYCADFAGYIGGTAGGESYYSYTLTTPNVWSRLKFIVRRTEGGTYTNAVGYFGRFQNLTGIEIGVTCKIKNPIIIDVTQMFGEGNEPTSVTEFEKILALNGIDVTTYHAKDNGTEQYWIIP